MTFKIWLALLLALQNVPADEAPSFVREGDRVEQVFREYRESLTSFYNTLRSAAERDDSRPVAPPPPPLMNELREAPPRPVTYGYQLLPALVDDVPTPASPDVDQRNYSWPITASYIEGEKIKLEWAITDFRKANDQSDDQRREQLRKIIRDYRELINNQKTIDQYIQYNRFWQRSIAVDRPRFDVMTEVYTLLQEKNPDLNKIISETLGKPAVPSFVRVARPSPEEVILTVPLYTDIEDDAFLAQAKSVIEDFWKADDTETRYRVEIDLRKISTAQLYKNETPPAAGARFEIRSHASRFPDDGAALTTGAQSTHSSVGRYVALGKGDVSFRTLAHEFGHVLGFQDGYVRGYRDLGKDGFEIMEITPKFDDLMSAPRQGRVQVTHFKLLLANLPAQ